MPKPSVYISRLLPDAVMRVIAERFDSTGSPPEESPSRDRMRAGLQGADAMICTLTEQVDADLLAGAPRLRLIANCAVGYNNIAVEAAKARGIVVTNTPDILTETTADLAWALLLAVARRVPEGHQLVQTNRWTGWGPTQLLGSDVHGKTLGIVGMGRIGRAVARRAAGFGMPVLYCGRDGAGAGSGQRLETAMRPVSLQELLAHADFISLHVPLTADTRHLIGQRQIDSMRPTAYLINTSRGPIVDEAALVEALRANRIAGAALDVYEREPEIHPGLRGLSNVVTLPHVGSATLQTRIAMGMACVENVTAYLIDQREPPNRVA